MSDLDLNKIPMPVVNSLGNSGAIPLKPGTFVVVGCKGFMGPIILELFLMPATYPGDVHLVQDRLYFTGMGTGEMTSWKTFRDMHSTRELRWWRIRTDHMVG